MAYIGQSMSVNAATAYSSGEMPFSKWTKSEILRNIRIYYGKEAEDFCKTFSVKYLKNNFFSRSAWHHTGKYYTKTDFFSFDDSLETEEIFQMKEEKSVKEESSFKPCLASWTDWEGTRKHPVPVFRKEYGRTDGKCFYALSGEKKLCSGKSFSAHRLKEKGLKEMKDAWKECYGQKTTHKFEKWLETGNC